MANIATICGEEIILTSTARGGLMGRGRLADGRSISIQVYEKAEKSIEQTVETQLAIKVKSDSKLGVTYTKEQMTAIKSALVKKETAKRAAV